MKIKQGVLWILLFLILSFLLYQTYWKIQYPQDTIYSNNIFDEDNVGAPIVNCSIYPPEIVNIYSLNPYQLPTHYGKPTEKQVVMEKRFSSAQSHCLITNIPYGKDNIYLKTSNPFIFYVLKYQFIVLILIFLWIFHEFKILQYMIQEFKNNKT